MMLIRDHPEAKEGEVCIGSYRDDDYMKIGWHTKRMGVQARSLYGVPLSGLHPVFVSVMELEA